MSREWKPGDVAMVNDCTRPEAPWKPATCYAARTPETETVWVLHDTGGKVWGSVSEARPLVVIDPEDREQVERLALGYIAGRGLMAPDSDITDAMQDALRELVKPLKPEEPTGLGAVVEDADGAKWVRVDDPSHSWVRSMRAEGTYTSRSKWDAIAAVRVLSEGVPES